jgi:predicted ATPase/class 3 adenylate cyclase
MVVPQIPTGTVTFLLTDIEGSTRLWEHDSEAMREGLALHDGIIREAVSHHEGYVFATGGDGFAVSFARAGDAIAAAASAQLGLGVQALPPVRMGVHTGETDERDGDYFGHAVNRTARLMAIAHGGQVLVSQATAQLVDGVELRDLGEHRLRDLSQPERVFQLIVAGTKDDFPPLRSLDALPTNLPVQLTTFVGRDDELKHITGLVVDHRLVTITGVGGVGKTRIALQVSAELLPGERDGVWLCELASAEDDDALADVVALALRAPARPALSLLESVVEFLRTKELLLVVDNCEHLLAAASTLVERVLQSCPGVRVIATSREGLGLSGEQLWPLRSLSMPGRSEPFDVVAASDAVQLFVDRARSVDPGFALDEHDAQAVGEICRRLDGIPLAIELAAARVAAMAPTEIASLLDERFRLLTGGRRRAVERHHTLRATVDWSYSLLEETERIVFDRLGVFSGTFDASAAQAVAASDGLGHFDVLDALGELVAKSMLGAEHHDGRTRYQLLETLRQYALEQLDEHHGTDTFRRRHAEHYAAFAERVGPLLLGSEELVWRPRLKVEIDSLRAAVGWAIERDTDDDRELALVILASLAREVVLDRGSGMGAWAERAIEATSQSSSPLRPTVMVTAAFGAFHRGDLDRAEQLASEACHTARESDPPMAAWAQMALANITASRGDLPGALALLDDVASWLPQTSIYDRHTIHSVIALYTVLTGDVDSARESARIGLEAAQELGQPSALAIAHYANGMVQAEVDPDAARRHCEASMALTTGGASDVVYANALGTLAQLFDRGGDSQGAMRTVRESIAYADSIGDRPPMVGTLHTAGRLLTRVAPPETVAVFAGGVFDGWFQAMSEIVPESDRLPVEALTRVEAELGADDYHSAWVRGAAMSYEELVAFALAGLDAAITLSA